MSILRLDYLIDFMTLNVMLRPMTPDELLRWRKALRLTQAQTADLLGVKLVTLQRWEQGANPIPLLAAKLVAALRRVEFAKPLPPLPAATPLADSFLITQDAWPAIRKWLDRRGFVVNEWHKAPQGSVVIQFTRDADVLIFRADWADKYEHDECDPDNGTE
jgi:transcriptional regulator with XRE-family HTH domain